MKLIKDLGTKYPRPTSKTKTRYGLYECSICKKHFETSTSDVKKGVSKCKSYGAVIRNTIHGMTKTRLYKTWQNMKDRCYNIKADNYCFYGPVGITICDEWKNDFIKFRDWALLNGYSDKLTIDRINPKENYEPNNCRWATLEVQARNKKKLYKNNTSGYRGVRYVKNRNRWRVTIRVNSKFINLGSYKTALEGAKAYDKYVIDNNFEHTINGA